jgi:hypothetical protein
MTIETIERPMFPPREIETYEPFATPDSFCETLVRIERVGSCRRLVFAVTDRSDPHRPARAVVAKLDSPGRIDGRPGPDDRGRSSRAGRRLRAAFRQRRRALRGQP